MNNAVKPVAECVTGDIIRQADVEAVCARALGKTVSELSRVTLIRFVLFDASARETLESALAEAGLAE